MPTFAEAKNHAVLAVGGYPSLAPGQTRNARLAEIVNQAGQYLYSRPWRFRERTSKYLSLVADQNYIALPVDAEELLSIISLESLGYLIEMVTPDHMEQLRQLGLTMTGPGVTHAVFARLPPADGAALPAVRLDIYPTPTGNVADAIAIRYRAGWVDIAYDAADSWEIPIPKYCDALFIAYCRAFAQAYEDEGLSARLVEIDGGPILATASTKDGLLQRDLGRIRPSRSPESINWTRPDYGYVQNPS
jgi:hypothetical protein